MHILSMEVFFRFGKDYQIGIYFTGVSAGGLFRTLCPSQTHIAKQISFGIYFHFLAFEENQYFFYKFLHFSPSCSRMTFA